MTGRLPCGRELSAGTHDAIGHRVHPEDADSSLELVEETPYQVFPPSDSSEWGTASRMGPVVRSRCSLLVVVTSREAHDVGWTLAQELRDLDNDVTLARHDGVQPSAGDYSAVIIGDSWWSRWHPRAAGAFVRANEDALAFRPSGYFSIHGERGYAEDASAEERFFRRVRWRPRCFLSISRSLRLRLAVSTSHLLGVTTRSPVAGPSLREFASRLSSLVRA